MSNHNKPINKKIISHDKSRLLMRELLFNKRQIRELKKRNKKIGRLLGNQRIIKSSYYGTPIKLYALRLKDGCWYVGMTRDPDKRFEQHKSLEGANWTKKHAPIEIFEIRETNLVNDSEASLLEDAMTLEYAQAYGIDFVRGGMYCAERPRWPVHLLEPDLSWIK